MKETIKQIEKWFRISNYVSVAQMYLKDNIFLERKLKNEDLKEYVSGHWGVSPSVNFIYAHLLSFTKRHNKTMQLVVGEGHAGSAVLANLFLQNKISPKYEKYPYNYKGLTNMIKEFGTIDGFRSEINPDYPDTIYDGGELGYSLAVSTGASINNTKNIIVCIIGDGEAETGTLSASWNLINCINNKNNGSILPILNLNGYKMGSKSIFSGYSNERLKSFFEAIGYTVYIVNESHIEMYNALEKMDNNKNNLIILKTRKGWTALNFKNIVIQNRKESHKNPLAKVGDIDSRREYIEKWLKSYKIEELISKEGFLNKDILELVPKQEKDDFNEEKKIDIDFKLYEIQEKNYSNIRGLEKFLENRIIEDKDFYIFSPDELESNFLGKLLENEKTKDNIIEILNENICQALFQGHIISGKRGIMISYEAFMPIVTSMLSQYEKYIYQSINKKWRKPLNSMTYILSSVWEENNYSHQNPEFLSNALEKDFNFINVYTPLDANSLIVTLDKCINEKNTINIIDISKRIKKQYKNIEEAKKSVNEGIEIFSQTKKRKNSVVLVAIGDYILDEMIEVKEKLERINISTRIIYISRINKLKELNKEDFIKYFGKDSIIFIGTHTYSNIIKSILFPVINRNICIEGYKDQSNIQGNYKIKLEKNNLSCEKIFKKVLCMLKGEEC